MATLIGIGRPQKKAKAEAPVDVPQDELQVTARAAEQIRERLDEEGQPDGVFRVGIQGGGCSGLSYLFQVEAAAKERDHVFEAGGVKVVVDPRSLKLLGGTLLDYRTELGAHGFEMKNPHVKSSCSCGSSFTV
jgi:iron-sulfur cluster assembly accessory protein